MRSNRLTQTLGMLVLNAVREVHAREEDQCRTEAAQLGDESAASSCAHEAQRFRAGYYDWMLVGDPLRPIAAARADIEAAVSPGFEHPVLLDGQPVVSPEKTDTFSPK